MELMASSGPRINIILAVVIIVAIVGLWALFASGHLPFDVQAR